MNGWNNEDVVVHFIATDILSGIESVTLDVILKLDGTNQSIIGTVIDKAGNEMSITVSNINIDKTLPGIIINAPNMTQYKTNESIKLDFTGVDSLSGIKETHAVFDGNPVTNGQLLGLSAMVGPHSLTITTTDIAGNVNTKTVTFTVTSVIDGKIKVMSTSGNKTAITNTLFPRFKIVNNGSAAVKLSDVKLRYYFTTDINMPLNFTCDWATMGNAKVSGFFVKMNECKANADYYLEVAFSSTAGMLSPGASTELHTRITKSDGSLMDQANDFSFSGDVNYLLTSQTPGYINDQLQFGFEPSGLEVVKFEKVKIQAYNSERATTGSTVSPRIKFVNTGNTDIKLSEIKIRYYYTKDSNKDQKFMCEYSKVGAANVTGKFFTLTPGKTTADSYLEIGFTEGAGTIHYGESIELNIKFSKSDNSLYTQTNDYSFNPTAIGFVDSSKITVEKAGLDLWGVAH